MDDAAVFWFTQRLSYENISFILIALFVSSECLKVKGQEVKLKICILIHVVY